MLKFHFLTTPDYIMTTVSIYTPLFFTTVAKLVISGIQTYKQNNRQQNKKAYGHQIHSVIR
ncbi:MAG: hypothetical protein B5M52_06870 [Helicobacteraceae bacterium 4484_230]|nr:MAG: hypothetical protein B5M52_06870 [Helicobacteraceae bacterium 4484_230]